MGRRGGFAAMLQKGNYNRINNKIFLFDEKIDCFAWEGYLFIYSIPAFQRIFRYFEELRARADQTVTEILQQIPIENSDEFRSTCSGQIQMISKVMQISRKPYLKTVKMDDIRRTIKEFGLDVKIVAVDGQERLLFESAPAKRWLILKLLDDNFQGSIMTHQKYEVNSKSAMGQLLAVGGG